MSFERGQDGTTLLESLSSASRAPGNSSSVESIDFDVYESQTNLSKGTSRTGRTVLQSSLKWMAIALVGLATGSVASGIDYGIEFLTKSRFGLIKSLINAGCSSTVLVLVHLVLCTSLAGIAAGLVCFVSPYAAGSGIPEVKSRLNGVDLPVVAPRTLVAKACGVLFSVSAGLPCGKEGPMIHSGAIMGALFARLTTRLEPHSLLHEMDLRDFIAAGGAAGVAAAFGAPVGGVLFALEEGASFWNPQVLLQTLLCSSVAALTLNLFLGGVDSSGFGTLGALGVLTFGSYFESNATSYHIWELPFFIALGIVGGLMGAAFNALNVPLSLWRMRNVGAAGVKRFCEAAVVAAIIALIFIVPPLLLNSCYVTDVKQYKHDSLSITCVPSEHHYDSTLGLFMTPSEDAIKVLFHDPEPFHSGLLMMFGLVYFALACWTYGLGVPSGLFVPSLLSGAVLGRLIGQAVHTVGAVAPAGMYSMVGAAASLAGMARITVSLAVIIVEATGNTQYIIPILFAVMIAKAVGDLFNEGIYDIHIHLKHVPFLESDAKVQLCNEKVSKVMTRQVESLRSAESLERLSFLMQTSHNAFPVVDGTGSLLGMLSRSVLADVARECPEGLETEGPEAVDLKPYVNLGSYSIHESATVRRAYALFRSMGLRHLPVVGHGGILKGIVTRRDFLEHLTRCAV